ncbi:hypothetical protein H1R20_g10789, partial [Candolleomyces eurysporus]
MHFTTVLFSVLTALTFTLNFGYAANLCTYASRGCSSSTYGCCNNLPAGNCCWWSSASLGWSVRLSNMSGSWYAACYGSQSCTHQMAVISVGGSTVCGSVPSANTSTWQSAGWYWNSRTGRAEVAASSTECRQPDVLGYTHSNRQYEVKVAEGQFDKITKLLDDGDYATLGHIATEVKA